MMGLARSTYYYKPKTDPKLKAQQDLDLRDRIEEIQSEFSGYGYRRVQQELKRRGETINTKRVRRVMKLHQLRPLMWERQVQVTAAQQQFRPYPNRIKYQRVTGLNQAWVADITYIRIRHSFIYLAAILDVYSRKVVGWALSDQIDRQLCLDALHMAIRDRPVRPGCIHHSDQGAQYRSLDYLDILKTYQFKISMSAKAQPGDNAFIESFFKTVKYEEVHLWDYQTYEDVIKRIPYFLGEVYNQKRLHSSIGYLPPVEFEQLVNLNHADQPDLFIR